VRGQGMAVRMGRRRLERMALAFAAAMTGALVASAPSHALSHTFDAGNLTIIADADETAEVACVNNEFILNLDVLESVSCDQVVTLQVNGGAGSNVLSIEAVTAGDFPQLTARTVFGGDGSDTVVGSPGDDDLDGGGGDDTLVDGKAGNDTITGGTGNDAAGGGDGDDEFIWNVGDGVDIAVGDGGTDRVAFNGNGDPDWLTVRPGVGDIDVDRNPPSAENPSTSEHVTANLVEEFALTGNGGADTIAALPDGDDNQVGEKLIVSGGAGNDTISGGDGNDTLSGGSEVDTITGGAGDDVINGDLHNDTLNGGEGADEIHGGQTNDTITGGPGDDELFGDGQDDTFIWNVGDGVDTVDGQGQHDTMQVNGDNTNEDLRVKPDENESLHAGVERNSTKLVDVQRVEKFALNGNDGNDVIVAEPGILAQEDSSTVVAGLVANGGAGEDDIAGGDGADSIQGGPGSDTIDGRAGNDAITWDVGDGDDAGVNGGDGADNALVGGNTDHETFTLGGDTDINVSRSAESQDTEQFDLAAIEKVTLDAGAGDDLISGGTGLAALGAETHISGGEGNDNIDGTDAADVIAGGTGVDTVAAAAGDDVLVWSAGDGADQSTDGGTGDDRAQVGGNANEERFEIGPDPIDHGKIKVERFDPKADIEADETLLYDGIERYDLSGNNGGDTLTAAADLETILTMSGGAGQDTLEGSDGTDTLRGDEANDTLEGNGGADTLTGGEGSDTLLGGAGDDVLVSTASSPANNDTVEGGDGDDTMSHGGQAGNQEWNSSVENVNGKDVLKLARTGPPGSILVDGVESLSIDLGSGDDRFFGNDVDYAALGVQRTSILGSSGNDETTGTNVTDQIVGDTGNDTLDGAGGNDVLSGGAGSDTIAGGDGDDTLLPGGGSGAVTDAIDGNDGDDTLQLVGSDADDTFVLEAGGVIFRHTATGSRARSRARSGSTSARPKSSKSMVATATTS
jgi:Ca2+-binding RTX toxin-like protein